MFRRIPRRAALCCAALLGASSLGASSLGAQSTAAEPEPVKDNSFLIEEAYNQEPRVVQHIGTLQHAATGAGWAASFTQEWPLISQRHQLSATVPFVHAAESVSTTGVGDVALNYRYQAAGVSGGPVAFAPRLSVVLPTGSVADGTGAGAAGVQVNLPLSVELGRRLVTHLNAGTTYTPRAEGAGGATANSQSYNLGQSLIWLATPTMNLMLEAAWTSVAAVVGPDATERTSSFVLAPGVRYAHNFGSVQVVPGAAYVVGVGPSAGERSVFTYLSFEHPF